MTQSFGGNALYHWHGGLRQNPTSVDATFENAAVGIAHVGLDGAWLRVNQRLLEIVGYDRDELMGRTFQDITHPDDLDTDLSQLAVLQAGKIRHYQMEKRYFRKDGEQIWVNLTVGLQRDRHGEPEFCISLIEDITARKADEEHLKVLIHELNHRVKNTLATVQAIAHMSFRKDEPIEEARADFGKRLGALASAHDLLTEEKWSGAEITQVIERALRPFSQAYADRIEVAGPVGRLQARPALTLAMGINELTTNAIKYGALSDDRGRVEIAWWIEGEYFLFEWAETGGPKIDKLHNTGFGSILLNRVLPGDFQGRAAGDFARDGFRYRLRAPAATLACS